MKEFGRYLMNDGRVNILGYDELENGCKVEISIHEWPNGHKSICKIFFPPHHDAVNSLRDFISSSFESGNFEKEIEIKKEQ